MRLSPDGLISPSMGWSSVETSKGTFTYDVRTEGKEGVGQNVTMSLIGCVSVTMTGGSKIPKNVRMSDVNGLMNGGKRVGVRHVRRSN